MSADFGTGVYHWSVDNYGSGATPVVGDQIAAFQGHHQRPWTITQRQFANNLHKVCFILPPCENLICRVVRLRSFGATRATYPYHSNVVYKILAYRHHPLSCSFLTQAKATICWASTTNLVTSAPALVSPGQGNNDNILIRNRLLVTVQCCLWRFLQVFKPSIPFSLTWLLASSALHFAPVANCFMSTFVFLVCMSQQFHAWGHMRKSELPSAVLLLQVLNRMVHAPECATSQCWFCTAGSKLVRHCAYTLSEGMSGTLVCVISVSE